MEKKGMKFLGMLCCCFMLLFVLPITVNAKESVTGGATFEEAVEIEFDKEYTTPSNKDGVWFKVYAPENTYIGVGYDGYSDISMYSSDKKRIGVLGSSSRVSLGTKTVYYTYTSGGGVYYYFNIRTTKAENCTFRCVCAEKGYGENDNPCNLEVCKEYFHTHYIEGYGDYYKIVAPSTGKYKIILKSEYGEIYCALSYKDGTIIRGEYVENETTEQIVELTQGMTYYFYVWQREVDETTPAKTTFQISNAKVSSISLNTNKTTMNKGDQLVLTANVTPENAVDKSITYTSSNPSVAIVSEEGIVTAVRGGSAVITADANDGSGVQAKCTVTVRPTYVKRLELKETSIKKDLATCKSYQLNVTAYPTDADDTSITYTSSNTSVVSVGKKTGKLTFKKAGTAVITCKTNDGTKLVKKCKVVLKQSRLQGYKKTINKIKYKVTSNKTGGGTVAVYGVSNKNLKSYTIPNTVKIDDYSYKVTEISDKAFKNCKKATKIVIGNKVKVIGTSAFEGCKKLTKLTFGSSVTQIGDKAFKNCTSLKSITIPSKVTTIGQEAFRNCSKLNSINIKSTKLNTVGYNALYGIKSKATIKVPSKKLNAYTILFRNSGW